MEGYVSGLRAIRACRVKRHKVSLLLRVEGEAAQRAKLEGFVRGLDAELRDLEARLDEKLHKEWQLSSEILLPGDVGRLCRAFHEEHERWYFARVKKVDFDAQTAEVEYLGYKETEEAKDSLEVQLLSQNKAFLKEGAEVVYIDEKTAKPRRAKLQRADSGAVWTLTDIETDQMQKVPSELIFSKDEPWVSRSAAERSQQLIDRLAINPNDTKAERLHKKKKIKKLKFDEKKREIERFYDKKTSAWNAFKQQSKGGVFGAKPS